MKCNGSQIAPLIARSV